MSIVYFMRKHVCLRPAYEHIFFAYLFDTKVSTVEKVYVSSLVQLLGENFEGHLVKLIDTEFDTINTGNKIEISRNLITR